MSRIEFETIAFVIISSMVGMPAYAGNASLTVQITGLRQAMGEVGCAIYPESLATAFPMDNRLAEQLWQAADTKPLQCRFLGLSPGRYAVAVSHDENGNHKTDTNWLGIPKEDWAVSRNARPLMRAPTFEEAAVELTAGETKVLDVRLSP